MQGVETEVTTIAEHEYASQNRHKTVLAELKPLSEGKRMGMDNISDKVNINVSEGRSGSETAMIAALLNGRNQDGNMNAVLPLLANGGGLGNNSIWPILLLALAGRGRVREVEVSVAQTVNQNQAQAQSQAQLANLTSLIYGLSAQVMASRQAQDIVNLGTMTASGTQAAANTQVR